MKNDKEAKKMKKQKGKEAKKITKNEIFSSNKNKKKARE